MVEDRRQPLQLGVEVGPDVVLHPLSGPQDAEARTQPGEPTTDGEQHDDEDVAPERGVGPVASERVHRALHRPRDTEREGGGKHETAHAHRIPPPVPGEISEEPTRRRHPLSIVTRRPLRPRLIGQGGGYAGRPGSS